MQVLGQSDGVEPHAKHLDVINVAPLGEALHIMFHEYTHYYLATQFAGAQSTVGGPSPSREAATARKFAGDWLLTGDLGRMDPDGYVFFKSRDDDVITSGGYRIGPGEIEECLMKHPAVAMVGVVGVPDTLRTEIVKAFVQLRPEIAATEALKADLAGFVKTRLAAHEYPREVEFVAELPLTTTGKIMRRELRRLDAERKTGR